MIAADIPIEQLKSWLKDLKRINHEGGELPESEEPTFYDDKILDILATSKSWPNAREAD